VQIIIYIIKIFNTFTVVSVEERIKDCPLHNCKVTQVVFDFGGKKYEFEYSGTKAQASAASTE
jgi:hypothetical protein